MYKLVIQDDEGKTTVVPLIREELTIGRKDGNTIRLTERNVSRKHARVLRLNGSITIEDLDSYNGVRVNGSRIDGKTELREADRVQIGDYLIEIRAETKQSEALTQKLAAADSIPSADAAMGASQATTVPTAVVPPPTAEVSETEPTTERVVAPGDSDAGLQAVAKHVAQHGKLVVLSTNLAGREFELDKPAMVIGRTDENDVWVNHRSISRHHAKIVRENGRYAIVDLQSSNGVRVNGEEYGKVELRRGDSIDLGHVRLRYVEAGEDFVFGRDAQPVDLSNEGKSRSGMWMVLLLLLVGGGVGAFVLVGGDDAATAGQEVAGSNASSAEVEPVAADSEGDVPEPIVEPGDETGDEVDPAAELTALLDEAVAARQNDDWPTMKVVAEKALALDPASAKAKEFLAQASMEAANEARYQEFQAAVAGKKFATVAALYAGFDATSVYRVKAQPDHDRLRDEYVKYQSQLAQKAAQRGDCRGQKRMARGIIAEWTEAGDAIMSHPCKQVVVRRGNDTGGETGGDSGDTSDTGGETTTTPTGPSYDELIADAKQAGLDNHYGVAQRLCKQALERKPGDQEAVMVCGMASCKLKQPKAAKKFISEIKSSRRQGAIRQICLSNGVSI